MAKKKAAAASEARSEELEARIAEDPSKAEPYLVYSDWLQQQGNPRGELIAVQTSMAAARGPEWGKLKVRELELLDQHADLLYGPLKKWRAARRTELTWRNGFIRAVTGHSFRTVMMELFAHPSARFLEKCMVDDGDEVSVHPEQPFAELIINGDKLAAVLGLARLRKLSLGVTRWVEPVSHAGLESLTWARPAAVQWEQLAKSALPKLKELSAWASPASFGVACELIAARSLESVRLQLGDDDVLPTVNRAAEGKIDRLALNGTPVSALSGLPPGFFERVSELEVSAPRDDQRDTYFQSLPPMPAVKRVRLAYPSDLVGWFRSFAGGTLELQVEDLEADVSKPAAGRALARGRYPKLSRLTLGFDTTVSPQFLESDKILGADAWNSVRSLALHPIGHLPVLAATRLGEQLEELTVWPDSDREGELLLEHVGRLKSLKRLRLRGERIASPDVITRLAALPLDFEWLGNRP